MTKEPSGQSAAVGKLFEPLRLGKLVLKNRIVLSPMAVLSADAEGRPTAQTAAILAARAQGGVGLVIVGGSITSERGFAETPYKGIMRIDVEAFEPDLAQLAAAVHAHGTPIIGELLAGFGRMGVPAKDRPLISASPINVVIPRGTMMPFERVTPMPQEASLAEIKACEDGVVQSALRLWRAGWDGVEIAAHMSYFLTSFLTPRTNFRRDDYGGSTANRARMLVNIVRGIRAVAGPDLIIGLRLPANEFVPGGQDASGFAAVAKEVEAVGLDYVAPTPGCYEAINETTDPKRLLIDSGELAIFQDTLSVPIILMGIHDPEEAGQAIADGHGDLIMMGRPLLADPELPNKIRDDRADTIVRCTQDNYCIKRLMMGMAVRCELNPVMGREHAVANGASIKDRSVQRRVEDALIWLSGTRPAIALAGFAMKLAARREATK